MAAELDDSTDAVILQRQNREQWEMPYLAAINCRGWHRSRRYFNRWHEVIHLWLDSRQLRFAFRKRAAKRKHPAEVLVDKITGELAFHPDLFGPVFQSELESEGRLTFDLLERVRSKIAPDSSRQSALYACLRHCSEPVFFLKARLGYKNSERSPSERISRSLLTLATVYIPTGSNGGLAHVRRPVPWCGATPFRTTGPRVSKP